MDLKFLRPSRSGECYGFMCVYAADKRTVWVRVAWKDEHACQVSVYFSLQLQSVPARGRDYISHWRSEYGYY
jgi:hypothetical protein